MKFLALTLLSLSLVAASPVPDADPAPSPITGDGPRPSTPYDLPAWPQPKPAKCGPIVCIRAPCLNSCCREHPSLFRTGEADASIGEEHLPPRLDVHEVQGQVGLLPSQLVLRW